MRRLESVAGRNTPAPHRPHARRVSGVSGNSRSSTAYRNLKERRANKTFHRDEAWTRTFPDKIAQFDFCAEFQDNEDGRTQVFHSRCAQWSTMRSPYSAIRFREHVQHCPHLKKKAGKPTLAKKDQRRATQKTTLVRRRLSGLLSVCSQVRNPGELRKFFGSGSTVSTRSASKTSTTIPARVLHLGILRRMRSTSVRARWSGSRRLTWSLK